MNEISQESLSAYAADKVVIAPFTLQQKFYWRIHNSAEGFHWLVPFAVLLTGSVHVEYLQQSTDELIRRHSSLRTKIAIIDGVPAQQIDPPGISTFSVVDLSTMVDAEQEARRLLGEESYRIHVLDVGPLFKVILLKLSEHKHVLAFCVHHILYDGYALEIMSRDFWLLYEACLRDKKPRLEIQPAEYTDYGIWQQRAHRTWLVRHETYWKGRLARAVGIRWPFCRGVGCVDRSSLGWASLVLDRALSSALRDQTRGTPTLISIKLLAAYVLVVSSLCKQRDFVLAMTFSGRDRPEYADTMGLFVHPVFLRIELSDAESLGEVLRNLGREYLMALSHKDFGETVLENFELCGRTLFQFFPATFHIAEQPTPRTGLIVESFSVPRDVIFYNEFDIEVIAWDSGKDLGVMVRHRLDVMTKEVADRFLNDMKYELQQISQIGRC